MKRTHLFLVELVLDLFLFAVCAAVCVGLLLHARGVSRESAQLTEAVYAAQTIAEEWRASGETPVWSQESETGLTGTFAVDGGALDIYIYQGDTLVYSLLGVSYLG